MATLAGVSVNQQAEFKDLVTAHHRLQVKLSKERDQDLGFALYQLVEAIPTLSAFQDLHLYGFGRFDQGLLPSDADPSLGEIAIEHPIATELLASCHGNTPTLETLKTLGCTHLYWC